MDETDYTPIDPKQVKFPPPQTPSEKLLKAIEDFYAMPTSKTRNT